MARVGEGNGIHIAFLYLYIFLIPLSLAGDLIYVGWAFCMVTGCFCSLDACSGFFFLKKKRILMMALQCCKKKKKIDDSHSSSVFVLMFPLFVGLEGQP